MEILGRQVEIGFAVEGTRGTAETAASRWSKKVTASIMPRATLAADDGTRGQLAESDGRRIVEQWVDGDVSGIMDADTIGYLLYNIYGAEALATVAGSVVDHTLTLDQSLQHPALTIFAKDGSVANTRCAGGVVNTLDISATPDDYVRVAANLIARGFASSAASPSYGVAYDFIGRDVSVKVADSLAGLSAATALALKNLTIHYDTGALRDPGLGSRAPQNIYNGRLLIELDITRNFTDTTFRDMHQGDTAKYVQVVIAGEADIGSGNHPTLTLTLNRAQVKSWERGAGAADELVTETVKLGGYFNAVDGKQSTCVLRNLTPEYATGS